MTLLLAAIADGRIRGAGLRADDYLGHQFTDAEEFLHAAARVGRDETPELLFWHWLRLTPEIQRAVILDAWEAPEFPVGRIPKRIWVDWFKQTGYVTDGPPRPDHDITVFRGTSAVSTGSGMSWTVDREKALWFAKRWTLMGQPGGVFRAAIPPRAVLASVGFSPDSRGEREIIVNPNMLRGRAAQVKIEEFQREPDAR